MRLYHRELKLLNSFYHIVVCEEPQLSKRILESLFVARIHLAITAFNSQSMAHLCQSFISVELFVKIRLTRGAYGRSSVLSSPFLIQIPRAEVR